RRGRVRRVPGERVAKGRDGRRVAVDGELRGAVLGDARVFDHVQGGLRGGDVQRLPPGRLVEPWHEGGRQTLLGGRARSGTDDLLTAGNELDRIWPGVVERGRSERPQHR